MRPPEDPRAIEVVSEWNGWRTAQVLLGDLENVHWFQPPGAPRPILHAYALCTKLKGGEIAHDCAATRGPHRLRLCILKSHTLSSTYRELAARADDVGTQVQTHIQTHVQTHVSHRGRFSALSRLVGLRRSVNV